MNLRILVTALLLASRAAAAQQAPPPAVVRPEVMGQAEASWLMDGWGALSRGNLDQASERVAQVNQVTPRSVHAMMLALEINMARAGATSALDGYEAWLAGRKLDHPGALRRIARGFLFELSRGRDSLKRIEALAALAAAGESAAQAALMQAATTGSLAEVRVLAENGHPGAIARLAEALSGPTGNKIALVDSLVESGSPQVIAPLADMLRDPRPEHRAAAAEGLGRLGARDQMNALTALLTNPRSTLLERVAAAGALLRMDNDTGLPLLEGWMSSEVPAVRLSAAQALASRHDQAWLESVRALAQDSDPLVRLEAAKLLAPYDRAVAQASVQRLMSDENVSVREEAVRAFARQLAVDFQTLRQLLRSNDAVTQAVGARRILELTR
jgi:HEAT repeat protein